MYTRKDEDNKKTLPFLFEGIFQHFDPPHQVLFHVLLSFPFTLKECNLSLKHTQTQHGS